MNKILLIGPSPIKSKGGMATVIQGIMEDSELNSKKSIELHESYSDGNILFRLLFSIFSFIRFIFIYDKYKLFYIHMASYGSTFRKGYYIRFLKKRNKKIVLHVHGAEYLIFYNNLSENKKKKVQEIWENSNVVIALSEEWKMQFESIFSHKNIVVINNGIDAEKYEKGKCFVDKVNHNFLFLGRLGKRKGTYDIISAVEKLCHEYPDILVYMAGDGEINKVRNLVNEKNLEDNIKVIGWINFEKKIDLLKKVGTVILPSYNEGLPMTLLEGMATGKAVISTDVGGIPELVVNKQNGLIIHPGDIVALCQAMRKIVEEKEFVKECSANNLKKIYSQFSRKKMHNEINNIFNKLN
ncbi:glycosyltransferase family 4 protein [Clostridium tertium]|uniref:glycosyltransferase family 4 protein n=1 Tax=Clostridium tertium TaxID=1559 RepID=UPI003DA6B2CD